MSSSDARSCIYEEILLDRLEQSAQMREFFLQMWQQNPHLAAHQTSRVQTLLKPLAPTDDIQHPDTPLSKVAPKQRGISLIELIMFIVIVSVALAGILAVMNRVTSHSADTLIRKQSLTIAESLLEEVELMPFTFCDPDDPSAVTATSILGCTVVEGIGPEAGEGRYASPQFDNVSDYNGFTMPTGAIKDITDVVVANLASYSATIAVGQSGIPAVGAVPAIPATEALGITVTVTGPDNIPVVLNGYRTRYAPTSVP